MFKSILAVCTVLSIGAVLRSDTPAPKPAEYLIGEMHVQNLPAMAYIYGGQQTTFAEIMDPINKFLPPLIEATDQGKLPANQALFIYTGIQQDRTKPFNMQIGMRVPETVKPFGDYKVRKLEAFKCATMLYTGTLANFPKAFKKLTPAIAAAGYQQTAEIRELYLYWDGPDSPNNVVQIQVGIQ